MQTTNKPKLVKCGNFNLRHWIWNSEQLIGNINASDMNLGAMEKEQLIELIWGDLCSEYDAKHLSDYFKSCQITFSNEFKVAEELWRHDEENHYIGFRYIYSLLTGKNKSDINNALGQRSIDFSKIKHWLTDEFTILTLLAYDEIATTMAYSKDYNLYDSFGPKAMGKWIRYTARDEAVHYANFIRIIRSKHTHRIKEAPALLNGFKNHDVSNRSYDGTFVLDHYNDELYFSEDFLNSCVRRVCKSLGLIDSVT